MQPNDFALWLTGFMDASGGKLTPDQVLLVAEKARSVIPYVQMQERPYRSVPHAPTDLYPYSICYTGG